MTPIASACLSNKGFGSTLVRASARFTFESTPSNSITPAVWSLLGAFTASLAARPSVQSPALPWALVLDRGRAHDAHLALKPRVALGVCSPGRVRLCVRLLCLPVLLFLF